MYRKVCSFSTIRPIDKSKVAIFRSNSVSPFVNLAIENWLFARSPDNSSLGAAGVDPDTRILYLWRNGPSVIIGKYQSAWKECDVQKMEAEKVNLVRRSSGGGAVYQDLGNSIYTFVGPKSETGFISRNNAILIDALKTFGFSAEASGRNDLTVSGLKVSGAAFRNSNVRSLHHGTLLLDVDMNALGRYLTPDKLKLQSKGVSSVEARVLNMKTKNPDMSHESVCSSLVSSFLSAHGCDSCDIIDIDESIVEREPLIKQVHNQLMDWNWRFGKEPPFTHSAATRFPWGSFTVQLAVDKGVITSCTVYSDALDVMFVDAIKSALTGVVYSKDSIRSALMSSFPTLYPQHSADNLSEFAEWIAAEI